MRNVELYPEIKPYHWEMLDVGDGHQIYYEEVGNPEGKPAVFLHGGPGGGIEPSYRRFFDPDKYRLVLLDQRGCGKSIPHAAVSTSALEHNTTWDLVSDLEKLRNHLEINSWLVFGGSWGSSLALAYAQTHPERVSQLVLRGIFTLRQSELDWTYNGPAANFAPALYRKYLEPLIQNKLLDAENLNLINPGIDTIATYHKLLMDSRPEVYEPAARAWTCWEAAITTLIYDEERVVKMAEDAFATAFARIENHYFVNNGWLKPNQLLDNMPLIQDIPGVIVQGSYDLCCPPVTAYELAQRWPNAEYHLVHGGHTIMETEIIAALVRATDRFADE